MIDSCEGHVYLTDWKNHENNSEPDFYLNLKSELSRKVAIMNLYPIGFILEINPPEKNIEDTTDITKFTTLKYDELQNVVMTLTITDKYSLNKFTNKFINENSNGSEK